MTSCSSEAGERGGRNFIVRPDGWWWGFGTCCARTSPARGHVQLEVSSGTTYLAVWGWARCDLGVQALAGWLLFSSTS